MKAFQLAEKLGLRPEARHPLERGIIDRLRGQLARDQTSLLEPQLSRRVRTSRTSVTGKRKDKNANQHHAEIRKSSSFNQGVFGNTFIERILTDEIASIHNSYSVRSA